MPQLSPSCASLGTNAGILPSVIASNLHQEEPPKAHPCTSFNASVVVDLPSLFIATTRESMSHQRTLLWDPKLTSRWAKFGLTALSKLPLFNQVGGFLLAEQMQCNCNTKQHLSLSYGCEKLDSELSLGPESLSRADNMVKIACAYTLIPRSTMEMPRPLLSQQVTTTCVLGNPRRWEEILPLTEGLLIPRHVFWTGRTSHKPRHGMTFNGLHGLSTLLRRPCLNPPAVDRPQEPLKETAHGRYGAGRLTGACGPRSSSESSRHETKSSAGSCGLPRPPRLHCVDRWREAHSREQANASTCLRNATADSISVRRLRTLAETLCHGTTPSAFHAPPRRPGPHCVDRTRRSVAKGSR